MNARHALPRADAARMINNAPTGTMFYVHVCVDLPCADNDTNVFEKRGHGSAPLTRKEAAKLVLRLYSDALEERGARVPLTVDVPNYWIG